MGWVSEVMTVEFAQVRCQSAEAQTRAKPQKSGLHSASVGQRCQKRKDLKFLAILDDGDSAHAH